jgi:hypothetical protein
MMICELTTVYWTQSLLLQELGWNQSKVEELLLPIIQKIQKRNQVCLPASSYATVFFKTRVPRTPKGAGTE